MISHYEEYKDEVTFLKTLEEDAFRIDETQNLSKFTETEIQMGAEQVFNEYMNSLELSKLRNSNTEEEIISIIGSVEDM